MKDEGVKKTYEHAKRLISPNRELISIKRKVLLQLLHGLLIDEEKNGAGTALEERELVAGGLPVLLGDDGAESIGGDVPELVVLGAEEEDGAVGLGVEGGGDVGDELADDLLDAGGGDGEVLAEGVVGAAFLDELEESGGHFDGFGFWLVGWKRGVVGVSLERFARRLRWQRRCLAFGLID